MRTDSQLRRSEAIDFMVVGNTVEAVARWKEIQPESLSAGEAVLYALSCIDSGSEDAPAMIDRVRRFHPLEGDALHAAYLHRQQKIGESIQTLHKLLVALRADSTPHPFVIRPCLTMIPALVQAQPPATPLLFDGLSQPFALMGYEEQRVATSAELASYLPAEAAIGSVAALEPNFPWTVEYLTLRARVYRQVGDWRATVAESDLAEFLAREPDRAVFPGSK